MPVGISVLSCFGHIFKFDLTLFWQNSLWVLPASVLAHICASI